MENLLLVVTAILRIFSVYLIVVGIIAFVFSIWVVIKMFTNN
jgi:hypothetical protein